MHGSACWPQSMQGNPQATMTSTNGGNPATPRECWMPPRCSFCSPRSCCAAVGPVVRSAVVSWTALCCGAARFLSGRPKLIPTFPCPNVLRPKSWCQLALFAPLSHLLHWLHRTYSVLLWASNPHTLPCLWQCNRSVAPNQVLQPTWPFFCIGSIIEFELEKQVSLWGTVMEEPGHYEGVQPHKRLRILVGGSYLQFSNSLTGSSWLSLITCAFLYFSVYGKSSNP
jgi:hypothetical protein